jgi:hypothetical protein
MRGPCPWPPGPRRATGEPDPLGGVPGRLDDGRPQLARTDPGAGDGRRHPRGHGRTDGFGVRRTDCVDQGQPGTHDIVDVMVAHNIWTTDGVVTNEWYNFEVAVGHIIWDADINILPGSWIGHYVPQYPTAPITFGPRGVTAASTLTWQCGALGGCPTTMPATIDVAVTASAIGAPQVITATGPGAPGPDVGLFHEYEAAVTLDTGGAITVPPLVSWSWLSHGWSRSLDH